MGTGIVGIIMILVKIGFWWLKQRDPEFVRRFDNDIEDMDKAIIKRDGLTVSVKYSELFKRARRRDLRSR